MTPNSFDCRFCAVCQKNITDFTQKTDAQILAHLRKNEGRICGRFRPAQLQRPLKAAQLPRRGGLTAMAVGVAATLAAQQPAPAPNAPATEVMYMPKTAAHTLLTQLFKDNPPDSLGNFSGKVTDAETGDPLIGCTVMLEGSNYGAITDLEGIFSLHIPPTHWSEDTLALLIRYTGYTEKRISLPMQPQKKDWPLSTIALSLDPQILGLVVVGVIYYVKPSFKQRFLHFFRRNR